ncbi:MAG: hypothetical protein HY873_07165 [Chloroflexi bacterium]|nr:hypothetical protein [Chloroflexota bacterium]
MATRIDDSMNPEHAQVVDALRRLGLTERAATPEGLGRAHAATLAAVRAHQAEASRTEASRTGASRTGASRTGAPRTEGPRRVIAFPRWRIPAFALAAAAAIAVVMVAQPSWVAGPVQAALGLSGGGSSVKVEGQLAAVSAGDDLASGKAKAEQRSDRTRFGVEVEDVASPPGSFDVRLTRDGTPVAGSEGLTIVVDSFGAGDLNLDSRDGDTVPLAQAGDLVEVVNTDGVTILSGAIAAK